MKSIDRIPGKSENDDMMIRFHHCLQKLYKGEKRKKSQNEGGFDGKSPENW